MAASLTSWLEKSLTRYSTTYGTNLEPFIAGQKVQILKWHTFESPFWVTLGDCQVSVYARFSDEAVATFQSFYPTRRLSSLKTSIIHLKRFRPTLVAPYQDDQSRFDLALLVDEFVQVGMDNEELHFAPTVVNLRENGGPVGEWVVELRTHRSASKTHQSEPTSSFLQSEPSSSLSSHSNGVEVPVVLAPLPLEQNSSPLRIDPSLPELTLKEYLSTAFWSISREEQFKQDAQQLIAAGSDTEACIARGLAARNLADADKDSLPIARPATHPLSPPSSSDDDDDEDGNMRVKRPRTTKSTQSRSPSPMADPSHAASHPPRSPSLSHSQSPSAPSSSRTASHSSLTSQERPHRRRTGSRAQTSSLRADGSKVLVEASDDEAEPEQALTTNFSSTEDGRRAPTPRQRSRLNPDRDQQRTSGMHVEGEDDEEEYEDAVEGEPSQSQEGAAGFISTFRSSETDSLPSPQPNKKMMMRRTGRVEEQLTGSPSLTQDADLMAMPSLSEGGTTSGSGSGGRGVAHSSRSGTGGAGVSGGSAQTMDVDKEEEPQLEELPESLGSNAGEGEVLTRSCRAAEGSESIEEGSSAEKAKEVVQEAKQMDVEQEMEWEMGLHIQVEKTLFSSSTKKVKQEPSLSTGKMDPPALIGHASPSPFAPRRVSPTPERRASVRSQAPPPSSGAFQGSNSKLNAFSPFAHTQSPIHAHKPALTPTPKRLRSPTSSPASISTSTSKPTPKLPPPPPPSFKPKPTRPSPSAAIAPPPTPTLNRKPSYIASTTPEPAEQQPVPTPVYIPSLDPFAARRLSGLPGRRISQATAVRRASSATQPSSVASEREVSVVAGGPSVVKGMGKGREVERKRSASVWESRAAGEESSPVASSARTTAVMGPAMDQGAAAAGVTKTTISTTPMETWSLHLDPNTAATETEGMPSAEQVEYMWNAEMTRREGA